MVRIKSVSEQKLICRPIFEMLRHRNTYPARGYADLELAKDREIVLAAVKQYGRALRYADPELTKNPEIVLAAVKQDGRALEFVDAELKGDKDVSTLLDELRLGQ